MSARTFRLPDLGEGLTEGEITRWAVAAGDVVALNQVIVEVETAKAVVEIPSPFAGVVEELLIAEGETVDVGTPIIGFAAEPAADEPAPAAAAPVATPAPLAGEEPGDAVPERRNVLVGYGPEADAEPGGRRRRRERDAGGRTLPEAPAAGSTDEDPPLAKPPVRKLAKTLGVDLRTVRGTGRDGVVLRADVEAAAASRIDPVSASASADDTRIPFSGVRKLTAEAMTRSAFSAPHVTEFVTVDVTRTVKLVRKLRTMPEFAGLHVTPLLVVARALLLALRATPALNASLDESAGEIVVHGGVNLGIAVAAPRGLLVPNVRGAQDLTLTELAAALTGLVERARAGKTSVDELRAGTITITNIGGFGIDTGTPIINPGEAAILCVGAIRRTPWEHNGRIALRDVMTISLSFDHRIADGLEGSALLRDVADILFDPTLLIVRSL